MTRASAVLDRNVLVRLVGYRNGTEEAGAGFLQTWSSVARAGGRVALCIAIWLGKFRIGTRWIAREIQEPNSFEFLDYAVPPRHGHARSRRLPADGYERLAAMYELPFRLFAEADVEPEVILYNLLEVIGPPQMSRAL